MNTFIRQIMRHFTGFFDVGTISQAVASIVMVRWAVPAVYW